MVRAERGKAIKKREREKERAAHFITTIRERERERKGSSVARTPLFILYTHITC